MEGGKHGPRQRWAIYLQSHREPTEKMKAPTRAGLTQTGTSRTFIFLVVLLAMSGASGAERASERESGRPRLGPIRAYNANSYPQGPSSARAPLPTL